jgi:hypothetical protein
MSAAFRTGLVRGFILGNLVGASIGLVVFLALRLWLLAALFGVGAFFAVMAWRDERRSGDTTGEQQ